MNWSRKMPKSVCVLLLGTALLSCSDQKEIQITGTVRNLNGGMIVYQQSIAGMMNTKTIDTLQIQSDSTFTLTLPVEDYERVNFILYGKAVLGSQIDIAAPVLGTDLFGVAHDHHDGDGDDRNAGEQQRGGKTRLAHE